MSELPTVNLTGRYRKLYPRIWRHTGFRALTKTGRELALYILTGPQTNRIGLFHFSIATAAEDLDVSVETLRKGLRDVAVTFGWCFDAEARVLYIPSWWRWNKPENVNVLNGNLKDLHEVTPCALVEAFAQNVETLPETLHETFIQICRERLPKRPPTQEQYQETRKQEHKQKPLHEREPKNGSEGSVYLPIARQVLKLTDSSAPMEHLLDAFYSIHTSGVCPKAEARIALNAALAELRKAH